MSRAQATMVQELGLDKEEVRLVPHNPHWLVLGEQECAVVSVLLGPVARAVEHVGSTSVPGIDAKPILDIAVAVDDLARTDDIVQRMCARGDYIYEGDQREDGGLLFVRGHGTFRTAHVHVVVAESRAWPDYLRFRRILMDDSTARDRYESEKRRLAQRFPNDRPAYTRTKGAVIEELLGAEGDAPEAQQD